MPGLTDDDKTALGELSDDEKAFIADFESKDEPDAGESTGGDTEVTPPPVSDDAGTEVTEPEGEGGGEEGTPEKEPAATVVRIGDRDVPIEDVQALLEFQEWSRNNPDKMKAFGQFLSGDAEFVLRSQQQEQERQEAESKIDWDLIDPQYKAIHDQQQAAIQEMQQRIEQTQAPIAQWQQQQQADIIRQVDDQISKATAQVKEKFSLDLTDEEVDDLHRTTAQLNILPGLRESFADPVEAVATALEMAIFRTPKYRDQIVSGQVATERAKDKRQLAGMVGSTSGSDRSGLQSPSEGEVKKMSPEDRNKAMAAEIAESMRGTA